MQRTMWRGLGGAGPGGAAADQALDALLNASDLAQLEAAAADRMGALTNVDAFTAFQSRAGALLNDRNVIMPLAVGGLALGALLLILPSGKRRRR